MRDSSGITLAKTSAETAIILDLSQSLFKNKFISDLSKQIPYNIHETRQVWAKNTEAGSVVVVTEESASEIDLPSASTHKFLF
ncbi:hypothetical protein JYU34_013844 [Plutella xylostella]|uniref:Uncharacterized protein n=1 Tax=Plutella xylostella TaxID=51655 RepID=A0ABQ7QC38_PLUXY|nr:hypothetical protein JYU34_013844 [Plutella xylostella]